MLQIRQLQKKPKAKRTVAPAMIPVAKVVAKPKSKPAPKPEKRTESSPGPKPAADSPYRQYESDGTILRGRPPQINIRLGRSKGEQTRLQARLETLAFDSGLLNQKGRHAGHGSISHLMRAIALLPDLDRARLTAVLRNNAATYTTDPREIATSPADQTTEATDGRPTENVTVSTDRTDRLTDAISLRLDRRGRPKRPKHYDPNWPTETDPATDRPTETETDTDVGTDRETQRPTEQRLPKPERRLQNMAAWRLAEPALSVTIDPDGDRADKLTEAKLTTDEKATAAYWLEDLSDW